MKTLFASLLAILLVACATAQPQHIGDPAPVTNQPFDITKTQLSVDNHVGNAQAAAYAMANGHPERAAVWNAIDTELTAIEGQIDACAAAIQAGLPKPPSAPGENASPQLLVEIGAETVGTISGIPANVKITCAPLPIPTMPGLPTIPGL